MVSVADEVVFFCLFVFPLAWVSLFESIFFPRKILISTVNAYLGKGLRLVVDLRESSRMPHPVVQQWGVCLRGGSCSQAISAPNVSVFTQTGTRPAGEVEALHGSQHHGGYLGFLWCGLQQGNSVFLTSQIGVSELWGHWQRFFKGRWKPFISKGLSLVQMWDGNIFVEGQSRSTQACSYPVVSKMKGAGLPFRSVTSSTTQLTRSLRTHADELIHLYSLLAKFHAKLPDCSICQSKQDMLLPSVPGVLCSGVRW